MFKLSYFALFLLSLMLGSVTKASDFTPVLKKFRSRYQLVRSSQGKLLAIYSKNTHWRAITDTLSFYGKKLKKEKKVWAKNHFIDEREILLAQLRQDLATSEKSTLELTKHLRASFNLLEDLDWRSLEKSPELQRFWTQFNEQLKRLSIELSPHTVAVPNQPRYFTNRALADKVVKTGMQVVKKIFAPTAPLWGIAEFLVYKVQSYFLQQRSYSQNMLVVFLSSPHLVSAVGLSDQEVNEILSSVFSARLSWDSFETAKSLRQNWQNYGIDRWEDLVASGNQQRQQISDLVFDRKLASAFGFARNSSRQIIHLLVSDHKFTSRRALAYNFSSPEQIYAKRILLTLGGFGLGLLPLPGIIKSEALSFVGSLTSPQQMAEAYLVAQYELEGDFKMARRIERQYVNPIWKIIPAVF